MNDEKGESRGIKRCEGRKGEGGEYKMRNDENMDIWGIWSLTGIQQISFCLNLEEK